MASMWTEICLFPSTFAGNLSLPPLEDVNTSTRLSLAILTSPFASLENWAAPSPSSIIFTHHGWMICDRNQQKKQSNWKYSCSLFLFQRSLCFLPNFFAPKFFLPWATVRKNRGHGSSVLLLHVSLIFLFLSMKCKILGLNSCFFKLIVGLIVIDTSDTYVTVCLAGKQSSSFEGEL